LISFGVQANAVHNLVPHLRTPNPGFNLGFTPAFVISKEGVNPGLNTGFDVLRFGLWFMHQNTIIRCTPVANYTVPKDFV
jgi:hypothetical protein